LLAIKLFGTMDVSCYYFIASLYC